MLLTAWAEGVGSNWVGFSGLDKVKALLDIPDKFEVLAILPFGYPVRAVGRGKNRRRPPPGWPPRSGSGRPSTEERSQGRRGVLAPPPRHRLAGDLPPPPG